MAGGGAAVKTTTQPTVGGGQTTEYSWGFSRREDENLTFKEKLTKSLYNKETGQILGRTPAMWGKLFLFYVIFYIVLAILFAICMKGLLMSVDPNYPKWQLEESLIGTNPGMGFRPMPRMAEDGSSLIWYQASNKTNVAMWEESINEFLAPYMNEPGHSNRVICDYETPAGQREGKVCNVDVLGDHWGPCTKKKNYGYPASSPCIFLKLNRIFGWEPKYYEDINELPEAMPLQLVEHIKTEAKKGNDHLKTIWVSCNPEGPADNESMGGVDYWPRQGFPGFYYPFTNQPGYLSPLVAVRFVRPPVGKLINVECRAWAKNIEYQRPSASRDRQGSVHFELLVDP